MVWWLKVTGAAMVVMASGLTGLAVARNYALRPRHLRDLQAALQMLETEIAYGATPLPEAFVRLSRRIEGPVGKFLARVAAFLADGQGRTAWEAWEAGLQMLRDSSSLIEADLDILRQFGFSLGVSDFSDQVRNLRLCREQLYAEEKKAEEERGKNERLWRTLGFLGGIVVVLIIF